MDRQAQANPPDSDDGHKKQGRQRSMNANGLASPGY
jgi:hypothetical protein